MSTERLSLWKLLSFIRLRRPIFLFSRYSQQTTLCHSYFFIGFLGLCFASWLWPQSFRAQRTERHQHLALPYIQTHHAQHSAQMQSAPNLPISYMGSGNTEYASKKQAIHFLGEASALWSIQPVTEHQHLLPGRYMTAHALLTNTSSMTLTFQAYTVVQPSLIHFYLHKQQCSCFKWIALAPQESIQLTERYYLSPHYQASSKNQLWQIQWRVMLKQSQDEHTASVFSK